jgi:hypothetical protein
MSWTDNEWLASDLADKLAAGYYTDPERRAEAETELAQRRARGVTDAGMDAARAERARIQQQRGRGRRR